MKSALWLGMDPIISYLSYSYWVCCHFRHKLYLLPWTHIIFEFYQTSSYLIQNSSLNWEKLLLYPWIYHICSLSQLDIWLIVFQKVDMPVQILLNYWLFDCILDYILQQPPTMRPLVSSDSECVDSAQFFRNSDSWDVSRITVSTLPLASKYPKFLNLPTNQVFWLEKFTQKTLLKTNPGQRG